MRALGRHLQDRIPRHEGESGRNRQGYAVLSCGEVRGGDDALSRPLGRDGIDIDRCQHITISDCRIDTADDCITLRASAANRLEKPQDCAYVTVNNCSLLTSCNAIRPGVGEGVVRDCVLSNLVISDTRTFLCGNGDHLFSMV